MRKLIAVLALATLAACGSDSTSSASFEGTWNLSTVNNSPLPYTFYQSGTERDELTSEKMVASAGKVYDTSNYRITVTGSPVENYTSVDTAAYSLNGNVVKIKYSASDSVMGTFSGSTLTLSASGITAVYLKQ